MVTSGNECIEVGPVRFKVVNQQVLVSQFSNNELSYKGFTEIIGFPSPFLCIQAQTSD